MNKHLANFLFFISLVMLGACSSSDNTTQELEETFPEKTPEEHKTSLETAGVDYVNQMSALTETEAVSTVSTLADFLSTSSPFSSDPQESPGTIQRLLYDISDFQERKITYQDLANRRTRESEGPESIQDIFEELKGTYTWNLEKEEWDYVEGGDVAIFKFPADESSTSNNATFTIQKYAGIIIDGNPLNENEEYSGDLPTEILLDLSVDGTKIMEHSFNASYNGNNGTPTSITTSIMLSPFTLSYNFNNTNAEIKTGYTLTENNDNILASEVAVQGNFDLDKIESSIENEDVSGFVTGGNAKVQLYDISFNIDITDIAGLEDEIIAIEDYEENDDYETAANKLETALNDHLDFKVKYESRNEIIALGIAEVFVEEETYNLGDTITYTDKWIEPALILEFGDGSKVALESYFESGFEELETAIEDLLEELGLDEEEDEREFVSRQ